MDDSTSNITPAGQDNQNQDPSPSSPGPHVDTTTVPAPPEEQPTGSPEYRILYLLSYVPSPLFPGHWSMWVPYRGSDGSASGKGTRLHVTGDSRSGFAHDFAHDFDRGYDPGEDDRRPWARAVARIEERRVEDPPTPEGASAPRGV
ncbi:hypothetical protein DL766_010115 [Monosporascus sp. MC13-8B]|uniref:Uncharacterized protein n=1 Tax=Monosporascus cannonballus TaxID=155416 RepID=A0ABY0GX11_9PEZI|nr:hypothetical protein DL762_009711 [Monosporascus cannonballus]RYP10173.1 hypothetical protein DL766_010115 [Monosporascus sp. MC13-8B]